MSDGDETPRPRTEIAILPAEPGWRVVVSNGKTTWTVQVLGWCVRSTHWPNEESRYQFGQVDIDADPLVVAPGGSGLTTVDQAVMGHADGGYKAYGLLAPGQTVLIDLGFVGWQEAPEMTRLIREWYLPEPG